MTFKPNLSVKEGLDHLATRLDPIIGERLAPDLGGHPWTVVLDILDEKKGHASQKNWTHDLQAQLRMLTERLGSLGYPFDDKYRTVSTLGSELRIVRNQMAHMHAFSTAEAFRANDFSVRLLEHFDDVEGLSEADRLRHLALKELAREEGVAEGVAAASATPTAAEEPDLSTSDLDSDSEPEAISPDPAVLEQAPSAIGAARPEYEPWTVVQIGTTDVLDDLPRKGAKEKVRAVAVEIATYEGPIQLDRLIQLTAQSFGMRRLHSGRMKKLAYQVRQSGIFVDSDKFAWPHEVGPGTWTEFRPNDSSISRKFTDISPVEIANAARFIHAKWPELTDKAFDAAVLQTFGRKRATRGIRNHLAKAKDLL